MPMQTTLLTAGILALVYFVLSFRVVQVRRSEGILFGDAGHQPLLSRMRAHANFAEYVPLLLILLGLVEYITGRSPLLTGLAALVVAARVLHAIGMAIPRANLWRVLGTVGTWAALAVLGGWAMYLGV